MDRDKPELAATVVAANVPAVADDTLADAPPVSAQVAGRAAPNPAELVSPRYRLGRLIGQGGMGEVVSARDEQLGRNVAIKRIKNADAGPEEIARFLREARIQGRLEHPAIVPVHEMSRDEHGRPFFVMKKLSGTTLADALAATDPEMRRKYPRQRLLRAFAEVCLAIELAHTHHVVHRDLKPANIMLGEFGEVYVLDWGIARILDEDDEDATVLAAPTRASHAVASDVSDTPTVAGAMLGTPGYMSAEQIRGDADLDARTDIHALGCILFEILAGEPLYAHGVAGIAAALAGVDARPSLRHPALEVPPELDAACLAATMADRADRLATARELGDLVQQFLDGDRDLSLRRDLSRAELTTARAALAADTTDDQRREAMRAAARAVALDPHAREPAELLARLMIEPPKQMPREVVDELRHLEDEQLRAQGRTGIKAIFAYLVLLPVIYATGIHSTWFFVGAPLVVLALMASAFALSLRASRRRLVIAFALNAVVVAMYSRLLTPFLIAPMIGGVVATVFAMHPRSGRGWQLYVVMLAAILGPWALELVGVLSKTTSIEANRFVLSTAADALDPTVSFIGLALSTAVLLALTVALSRQLALQRFAAQTQIQLQAWQMRQLVPRVAPETSEARDVAT